MPAQKIHLLGFAPDLPQDTPGVIVDSSNVLPTTRGIKNGYGIAGQGMGGATGTCLGATAVTTLGGAVPRFLCGTATQLLEARFGINAFVNVSGATYAVAAGQQWSFSSFGNVALAVNLSTNLQASTAAFSNFATVTGAPKAAIVVTCGGATASFAMCFNYNDGTNAFSDGVFWSALGDYTNWTPSLATQCGNVRLLDVGGEFTAAIPYRDGVVAFKSNAMYLGSYVGGAAVWSWTRIAHEIGCIGQQYVCEAQDVLYFLDTNGLWEFDGSYPRRAPGYVSDFLDTRASASVAGNMIWDAAGRNLLVPYTENAHTSYLALNLRSGLWTRHGPITDGTSYVGFLFSNAYGAADASGFDMYALSTAYTPGTAPYFTLAALGSPFGMTTLGGVRPQFLAGPADSATGWLSGTLYYGPSLRNVTANNVAMTVDATSADNRADRLDVLQTARFLSPKITVAKGTAFEVSDVYVDADPAGDE